MLAVARCGSFKKAGEALGIDQATVSRRVANLERRAGMPLFTRRTTGAEATDIGRDLVAAAEEAARAIERFERSLHAQRLPSSITVAAPEGIGTYFLGPHLSRSSPAARELPPLRIVPAGSPADIEIAMGGPAGEVAKGSDWRIRRVGAMQFATVAGRGYLSEHSSPERPGDLRHHDLLHHVVYDMHPAFRSWTEAMLESRRVPLLTASTSSALHRSVISAGGITLLPDFSPIIDSAVVCVPCGLPDIGVDLFVTAHPDALRNPSVRRAFDTLIELFLRSDWFQRR